MNLMHIACFSAIATVVLWPPGSPAWNGKEVERRREVLKQRAEFFVSGRMVDEDGEPLGHVRLTIDVRRFDIDTLETPGRIRTEMVTNSVFEVREEDATAVVLRASKTGYLDAQWQMSYRDLLEGKRRMLESGVHKFTGLQAIETNLVLVLRERVGALPEKPTVLPRLSVGSHQFEAKCSLFPADGRTPRVDLRLVLTPPAHSADHTGWKLTLHAGKDGGILRADSSKPFREWHHAPETGYRPSIQLPVPRRHASTGFFLKSPEGYFAKAHARIERRPGHGTWLFEIFDAAIQTDGSRVLDMPTGEED